MQKIFLRNGKYFADFVGSYPVDVTETIRLGEDEEEMVIVNNFPAESRYARLADPLESRKIGDGRFYYVVAGPDARFASVKIRAFCERQNGDTDGKIHLVRATPDGLVHTAYGYICTDELNRQDELRARLLGDEDPDTPVFIIPLMSYQPHRCPVCAHRTLAERGYSNVCEECGWEDTVLTSPEANGCSLETYRAKYLRLKRANPAWMYLDRMCA